MSDDIQLNFLESGNLDFVKIYIHDPNDTSRGIDLNSIKKCENYEWFSGFSDKAHGAFLRRYKDGGEDKVKAFILPKVTKLRFEHIPGNRKLDDENISNSVLKGFGTRLEFFQEGDNEILFSLKLE